MISLERIDPSNYDHLDRYAEMQDKAYNIPEVADRLSDFFEEGSLPRIQKGIRSVGALRYFVVIDGNDVGRMELSRHLNNDPSIEPRIPEGVNLGYNTCYFINPTLVGQNLELAHKVVADKSIREAFLAGDAALETAPWIPVSLDGQDASRGWLMQEGNPGFIVTGDEPKAGIFPQFGIGDNEYSLMHATLIQTQD